MLGVWDLHKLVLDAMFRQLGVHHDRLFEGHVGVGGAVDEQCGRIVGRHVLDRHVRDELLGLRAGIPLRDLFEPDPLLAAERRPKPNSFRLRHSGSLIGGPETCRYASSFDSLT